MYYGFPLEPSLTLSAAPLVPALWAAHHAYRRGWHRIWPLLAAAAVICVGFLWTQAYTHLHPVTMLTNEVRINNVSGRIIEIGDVPEGYRITLDSVHIEDMPPEQTPERVRLKLRGDAGQGLLTGQQVSLRAGILPPSAPVLPHAFDFARYFYFMGIGGVGYGIPPVTILHAAPDSLTASMRLASVRESMSRRIRSHLPEAEGAIAAALMMGDRAAIPEDVNEAMRDTNLSHILSISGLHMALLAGIIFFSLRWMIAALPLVRDARSPKKLAAWIALSAAGAYLILSGFPVSACRAYMMVALMLLAVIIDRQVMPMRSLGIAALLLLLINPSFAMQASFQLSFLATAALIAWYERVRHSADDWFDPEQRSRRIMLYIGGVLMTSLIAELATAPLVLYHFNQISFYGIVANLLISPVVSFWIMPLIVAAFALWPLGLEWIALVPAGWGISLMIHVAKTIAAIPGALIYAPSLPALGMALAALGTLWIIVWHGRMRWAGLAGVAVGLVSMATITAPDMLISADTKQIAAHMNNGTLMLLRGRAGSFVTDQWAHGSGQETLEVAPKEHKQWRCDTLGCVYTYGAHRIAFGNVFEAVADDCLRADVVVSPFYTKANECTGAQHVIDRATRENGGAHWLWFEGDNIKVQSASSVQGKRPWSAKAADYKD